MNRIIAILMVIVILFATVACGNSPASTSPKDEMMTIDRDGYSFAYPSTWTLEETEYQYEIIFRCSNPLTEDNIYNDSVQVMEVKIDNTICTREQAEEYTNIFIEQLSLGPGYEKNGPIYSYDCNVPACWGMFKMTYPEDAVYDLTTYVFMVEPSYMLHIVYWHDITSQNDYSNEFLQMIDSMSIPDIKLTNSSGSSSSNSSFTNKYGTATTKCAHAGCNNYIASSGDTNCCTVHSNKCLECKKYIDEDAMYCMSCLTNAASKGSSNSSSSFSNSYGEKCHYKEGGKEVCNNPCASGSNFCSFHTEYLNDAHNYWTGK